MFLKSYYMKLVEIQQKVRESLDSTLVNLIVNLHVDYKTKSGDISPEQQFNLEDLSEKLSNLIGTQIYQNL